MCYVLTFLYSDCSHLREQSKAKFFRLVNPLSVEIFAVFGLKL